jgi:centrosomal protein CEP104
MLMSCSRCQQVIEIATLPEHLLDECEHKDEFEPCPKCTDAVPAADLKRHMASPECKPMPDPAKYNRCPLCRRNIPPNKEGWLQHLLDEGCPANPRTNK